MSCDCLGVGLLSYPELKEFRVGAQGIPLPGLASGWVLRVMVLDATSGEGTIRSNYNLFAAASSMGYRIMLSLDFEGEDKTSHGVGDRVSALSAAEGLLANYFSDVYGLDKFEFKVWRVSSLGSSIGDRVSVGNIGEVFEGDYGYNVGRVFKVVIGAHWGKIWDEKLVSDLIKLGPLEAHHKSYIGGFQESFCTPIWVTKKLGLDVAKYRMMVEK